MSIETLFDRAVDNTSMQDRYAALKQEQPSMRQRDVAEQLLISEAEMLHQQLGVQSLYLNSDFANLLRDLPSLGYVMILLRNEYAVHERKGVYDNVKIGGPMGMGLIISADKRIDLRLFLKQWKHGFAVRETLSHGSRFSLQFFDENGVAIQKLFLQDKSDMQAYARLVTKYRHPDQQAHLDIVKRSEEEAATKAVEVDQQALYHDWSAMTDVHQFVGLLKKHTVTREQAFDLVGEEFAQPFDIAKLKDVLMTLAEQQVPIMCFVGNKGGIQIHSGVIHSIVEKGDWLNILDPEFNLHLLMSGISRGWLIRKPTSDGIITSLELYDETGGQVAQFFGKRVEKSPENLDWRAVAEATLVA
ncbi:ChuX/HutX family heme-like substrate-binding protein [Marinomonas sp. THO17]|uniref:hemin-degrading factor n=1 Tax=Marinomonas sp. THO17 TaxID=3149048 RepID=UPI00336BD8D4